MRYCLDAEYVPWSEYHRRRDQERQAEVDAEAYRLPHHDKGRDCARTDEVLDNYRRRALAAEAEVLRLGLGAGS